MSDMFGLNFDRSKVEDFGDKALPGVYSFTVTKAEGKNTKSGGFGIILYCLDKLKNATATIFLNTQHHNDAAVNFARRDIKRLEDINNKTVKMPNDFVGMSFWGVVKEEGNVAEIHSKKPDFTPPSEPKKLPGGDDVEKNDSVPF